MWSPVEKRMAGEPDHPDQMCRPRRVIGQGGQGGQGQIRMFC